MNHKRNIITSVNGRGDIFVQYLVVHATTGKLNKIRNISIGGKRERRHRGERRRISRDAWLKRSSRQG
jgi:hypothetical protein